MRKPNKKELKKIQEFYNELTGLTTEEFDISNYHIYIIEDYISECPGYNGDVILCIFAHPEYHDLLIYDDSKLKRIEREK